MSTFRKISLIGVIISCIVIIVLLLQDKNKIIDRPTISVINPIRSRALGLENADILASLQSQFAVTRESNIKATWLLQSTVLEEPGIVSYIKKNMSDQELGIWLEVDKSFADRSGVGYKGSGPWYWSDGLFPVSYDRFEREKLIDTVFAQFKREFGYYPKSVGAWWVGAETIEYIQKQYGVIAILQCADQFGTDGYSLWGTPWSIPYTPASNNAAVPARQNKYKAVILQWASRDPYRGYGPEVVNSTFSMQDYEYKGYDVQYFDYLVNTYLKEPGDQLVIGLEGGMDPESYKLGYAHRLKRAKELEKEQKITIATAEAYASDFLAEQSVLPKTRYFLTKDFSNQKQSFWYHSPRYRVGLQNKNGEVSVVDIRSYSNAPTEEYYAIPNTQKTLRINAPAVHDTVRFPDRKIDLAQIQGPMTVREKNGVVQLFSKDQEIARFRDEQVVFYTKRIASSFPWVPFQQHQQSISLSFLNNRLYFSFREIFILFILGYSVVLWIFFKKRTEMFFSLFLFSMSLVILNPFVAYGSSKDVMFLNQKSLLLSQLLRALPDIDPSLKLFLVFQIVPLLFLAIVSYLTVKYIRNKQVALTLYLIGAVIVFCLSANVVQEIGMYLNGGRKAKVIALGMLSFFVFVTIGLGMLYKKNYKTLVNAVFVLLIVSLGWLFRDVVFPEKRLVIPQFEIEALNTLASLNNDVLFLGPTIEGNYRAVKPMLATDIRLAEDVTGVTWSTNPRVIGKSLKLRDYKNKTIIVPRYLGSDIFEDEIKKFGLYKFFDNGQIALLRSI